MKELVRLLRFFMNKQWEILEIYEFIFFIDNIIKLILFNINVYISNRLL